MAALMPSGIGFGGGSTGTARFFFLGAEAAALEDPFGAARFSEDDGPASWFGVEDAGTATKGKPSLLLKTHAQNTTCKAQKVYIRLTIEGR
jgi:hypothetical protein